MRRVGFPLFKGATRLPTFWGIPRTPFIFTLLLCATLFMTIHFYVIPITGLMLFIEWSLTKNDDKMFRIVSLTFQTKVRNWIEGRTFSKRWGGSSYSPVTYRDRKNKNEYRQL